MANSIDSFSLSSEMGSPKRLHVVLLAEVEGGM